MTGSSSYSGSCSRPSSSPSRCSAITEYTHGGWMPPQQPSLSWRRMIHSAASVMAFGTILMTYLGVNYVLSAGLHSYGFGGSKIATWLVVGGVVEIEAPQVRRHGGSPVPVAQTDTAR